MKRVHLEMVVEYELDVPAADDEAAIELAHAIIRTRYRGEGYTIRNSRVVRDLPPDTETGARWLWPGSEAPGPKEPR